MPGAFSVGVSPDNQSALIVNAVGDEWQIAAVPRSGEGAPRGLVSFPRPHNVWGIDAARDGSVYFDYMVRQSSVLQFDTAGKALSETVVTIGGAMLPLDGGSFLVDRIDSGKRRLKVFRADLGERNLLESSEESSSPAARIGADSVAFLLGPHEAPRVAIATLRDGRIVKRFPFDAASVKSIAATPDGKKLYYCSDRQVWWVGTKGEENIKPLTGKQKATRLRLTPPATICTSTEPKMDSENWCECRSLEARQKRSPFRRSTPSPMTNCLPQLRMRQDGSCLKSIGRQLRSSTSL